MHETTIPYINSGNIDNIIREFIVEVMNKYGNNIELNMLIVGGSALAIKYGYRGTVDIDSDIRCGKSIKQCILNVASKLNIPKDCINEDFCKSNSYSRRLWDTAILIKKVNNVNVYVVSDLDQLCMKITSGRVKDKTDIMFLCDALVKSNVRFYMVEKRLEELYLGTVKIKRDALKLARSFFKKNKML